MVTSVSVTPDGKRAVSASVDKTLRVWDLESGKCLIKLKGHTDRVTSVSVTPDGKKAVSASVDKTLRVWNLESGNCLKTINATRIDRMRSVAVERSIAVHELRSMAEDEEDEIRQILNVMLYCPNCGMPYPRQARFCPRCGVHLAPASRTTGAWSRVTPIVQAKRAMSRRFSVLSHQTILRIKMNLIH